MTDLNELLGYLSTDTLESVMHDLQEVWVGRVAHGSDHDITDLHDFLDGVEKAIKGRIIPVEPPVSSGSPAQITGLLKNE